MNIPTTNARVIPARDWRRGLEYAITAAGEALTDPGQLADGTRWSTGMPVWASPGRPLVVREVTR